MSGKCLGLSLPAFTDDLVVTARKITAAERTRMRGTQ